MSKTKIQNQVHPPRPKWKRVDAKGNDNRRLFFKCGNSTMLFARGLTENGCKAAISHVSSIMEKLGSKVEGKFIITR
jgi:hypothetical protein